VALREMLPTLTTQPEAFQPVPHRSGDPSRYFESGEILVQRRLSRIGQDSQSLTVPEGPTLYLRVTPTKLVQPLKRAEAFTLIQSSSPPLESFDPYSRGSSIERNQHGAVRFEAHSDAGQVTHAVQLFLTRELWGFNTQLILADEGSFPTLWVEQTFISRLGAYAHYMSEALHVPPPYHIEAGASHVQGIGLAIERQFGRLWGPIQQEHVTWTGKLASLDAKAIDEVLLQIFEAFFDAGAETCPKRLYGFPDQETPG
jgi:hypothetical protein